MEHRASGVFVHAENLAEALVHLGVKPVVLARPGTPEFKAGLDRLVLVDSPWGATLSRGKPIWPLRVGKALERALPKSAGPVVLHGLSNFNVPYRGHDRRVRIVVTVHDIIPLIDPHGVSGASHWQLRWLLPKALAAADKVVCVSEWTRRTLVERFPKFTSKFTVIANGKTPLVESPRRVAGEKTRLLTVARSESYKQLDLLVRIVRALDPGYAAILVTDVKGLNLMKDCAKDLLALGRLTVRVGLSAQELGRLYEASDVYLHPSRYEGYCLPAVDVLAHGCPVVYQKGSGIDEVAGSDVGFAGRPLVKYRCLDRNSTNSRGIRQKSRKHCTHSCPPRYTSNLERCRCCPEKPVL